MNLVIDDAVEVKLATKSEEESRRSLGKLRGLRWGNYGSADSFYRTNTAQGRQCVIDSKLARIRKLNGVLYNGLEVQKSKSMRFWGNYQCVSQKLELYSPGMILRVWRG
jgi:hypothetical protein